MRPAPQKIGILGVIQGHTLAVIQVLTDQPKVFLAFCVGALGPTAVGGVWGHGWEGAGIAVVTFVFFFLTSLMGRSYKQVCDRLTEEKLGNEKLVSNLRDEKEVALQARYLAEASGQSKSQFLAAASHDLRQPLHAISLYTDTLRRRIPGGDTADLVESIGASVEALDALFTELMDIAKLDAGAMVPVASHFSIGALFRRVEVHARPLAFEKGLDLKFRGGHHIVHADQNLLERVLRNLVSNAIRYTEDGGVLVTCRRRGGKLLLQVWDSGIGIAEEDQQRIFEEFYRVTRSQGLRTPVPRGMGLGLAIVRRLVQLLRLPLDLHSRLGHGTVFSLLAPLGDADKVEKHEPEELLIPGASLAHRLVVVVENDPVVCDAMTLLLQQWEASVAVFGSIDACRDWIERADEHGLVPHLAIVDYGLGNGMNGIDAIRMLRKRFGADLPAIVVTGALTAEVDQDVDRKTFDLVTKPVLAQKLRSIIAFHLHGSGGASR